MTTKNKYYDIIQNKATKTADILIYGVIGDSYWQESLTARSFVSDFRNLEKDFDVINIRINSPGGSVWDGHAIFNAISTSAKEIHTYNDGLCASMAAVILLSVKPENVHPANNSLIMLHSPSTGAYGNKKDIEKVIDVLDKVQTALITSICDKTGLNKDEVEAKYFDYEDHWFTADEAKSEGLYLNLADFAAENVPQNASALKYSDLVKLFEPSDSIFTNWIGRIAPESKITTETDDTLIFTDMDISKIRAMYPVLTEDKYPTEESVLDFLTKREKEFNDLQTAKNKAETDLATANQTIEDKNAEIVALGKKPGASTAVATTDTDDHDGDDKEDKPAEDFFTAFAKNMNVLKPQNSK
jgi:ATP-dependent Clp endopeptidase proteolytic subunit ClpP